MEKKEILKNYLIQAVYSWCHDNNLTPYLEIKESKNHKIPADILQNVNTTSIIFNLSGHMVKNFFFSSEGINFIARMNGREEKIFICFDGVRKIYASELTQGIDFTDLDLSTEKQLVEKVGLRVVVDNT